MGNPATLRSLLTWPLNIRKGNLKRGDSLPPDQHRVLGCPLSQAPLILSLFIVPQSCQEPDVQLSPVFQEALLNVPFPAQVTVTALLISYCAHLRLLSVLASLLAVTASAFSAFLTA